jgi:hypothetical protein
MAIFAHVAGLANNYLASLRDGRRPEGGGSARPGGLRCTTPGCHPKS